MNLISGFNWYCSNEKNGNNWMKLKFDYKMCYHVDNAWAYRDYVINDTVGYIYDYRYDLHSEISGVNTYTKAKKFIGLIREQRRPEPAYLTCEVRQVEKLTM
ncbi:unnamed protein product [Cylicocyclus nassatus]|uniref:Uncharacterized protein n=1 Tax=Cylicocyclus nassatus TaxID=53992 RepID=A0AA36DS46_CYLNA|nr:unnamed protein product [Cylicocyclus nassatus]